MNAENANEKRLDPRYEILEYAMVFEKDQTEAVRGVIVDIGLGGLQLRSRSHLNVGSICDMNIGNLNSAPIKIRGEVRHSQPVQGSDLIASGIRFLPQTPAERATVAEFVHSAFQRQADILSL